MALAVEPPAYGDVRAPGEKAAHGPVANHPTCCLRNWTVRSIALVGRSALWYEGRRSSQWKPWPAG